MRKQGSALVPTLKAFAVVGMLEKHFGDYVDYDFTARLEDDLDAVSLGEKEWVPLLDNFWRPFKDLCDDKEESVTREQVAQARELGTDPKSGKPVTVRMGRYGPFVQIGSRDDEDKPRFAGLRPGQKMNEVTLEEALELFKLPRKLGETPEGEPVSASIGRFGPYVRYGDKYVSIKEDDPYTIELPRALELIAEKKKADAERLILDFEEEGIQVLNGRYGPYITDGNKNAKVPKDREPKSLTLEECQAAIAAARVRASSRTPAGPLTPGTRGAAGSNAGPSGSRAASSRPNRPTKRSAASGRSTIPTRSPPPTGSTPGRARRAAAGPNGVPASSTASARR